jgi:hypothetical protein
LRCTPGGGRYGNLPYSQKDLNHAFGGNSLTSASIK